VLDVEQRGDRLEIVLDQFVTQTNEMMAEMRAEARESRRDIGQVRAYADRIQDNTDRMEAVVDEIRREGKEMNRKWAELAQRLGTIVEDIVAPNIPGIAREQFGCQTILDFMLRRTKVHPLEPGRSREFDVICVGENIVIWNETKATMRPEYVTDFVEALPEFREYFPEYERLRLIPIFASLNLAPDIVRALTRRRIYAMTMGERTMELVNFAEVSQQPEMGQS